MISYGELKEALGLSSEGLGSLKIIEKHLHFILMFFLSQGSKAFTDVNISYDIHHAAVKFNAHHCPLTLVKQDKKIH